MINSTTRTFNLQFNGVDTLQVPIHISHNVDKIIVKNIAVNNDQTDAGTFEPIFSVKSLLVHEQILFSFPSLTQTVITHINHEFFLNSSIIKSAYKFDLVYANTTASTAAANLNCSVTFSLEFQQLKN